MSLDFPAKFNNWDRVDPNELFGCPTEQKEATPKLKMPAFLSSEAKNADYLGTYLPYNIVRMHYAGVVSITPYFSMINSVYFISTRL